MSFFVTVPYKTTPNMQKHTGNITEVVHTLEYMVSKTKELQKWNKDLYACRRPDLVKLASKKMLTPVTYDIVQFAMNFKEDVAILHNGILESICFCYPSSWIPSEKIGMSLTEIHTPVADGELLQKMSQRIAETMATQGNFRRYVWTISSSNELSNHPYMIKPEISDATVIEDLYLRTESQTSTPLGDGRTSLFFVKVEVTPLKDYWVDFEKRKIIIDSINSMTENVLRYKNLIDIKKILNKYSNLVN